MMIDDLKYKDGYAIMKRFFSRWKDSEMLRRKRMLLNAATDWIFRMKINFEE